jgi:hypothetical protein
MHRTASRMPHAAAAAVLLSLAATTAEAAGPRPLFKQPFGCAQRWDASTYAGHVPDEDSVDLYYWRDRYAKAKDETENLSHGQYVYASAAGTVEIDHITPDNENGQVRMFGINHGNGWVTRYLHLIVEDEFLEVDRPIAMGEVIGRTGRSGTDFANDHIHYVQRRDGEAVRVRFDDVPISTHAGNRASYDTAFSEQAERIRSANCTGHRFVRWRDGGQDYVLRYRPETGSVRITRMHADGSGGTHTWSSGDGFWGTSVTHLVQYRDGSGTPYLVRYSAPAGRAVFFRLEPGGTGLTRLKGTTSWHDGWTNLQRVSHDGYVYLLAYDSRSGYSQVLRVDEDNESAAVTHVNDDRVGWTHVLPFDDGGRQYVLYYRAATGRMEIRELHNVSTGMDMGTDLEFETVFSDMRNANWTHLNFVRHGSDLYLLGYRATSGRTKIWRLTDPAAGPSAVRTLMLSQRWDIVTVLNNGGDARVFFYGTDAGDGHIYDFVDGGALSSTAELNWQGGWR